MKFFAERDILKTRIIINIKKMRKRRIVFILPALILLWLVIFYSHQVLAEPAKTFLVAIPDNISTGEKLTRQRLNAGEFVAGRDYVVGEILLKLKPVASQKVSLDAVKMNNSKLDSLARKFNVSKIDYVFKSARERNNLKLADFYRLRLSADRDIREVVAEFEKASEVVWAGPNYVAHADAVTPNDTDYSSQWHLNNTGQTGGIADADIDAAEAWDIETGIATVVVGVVDSGVDTDHIDLVDNIWVNSNETASNGIDDDGNGYIDDGNGWDFIGDGNWCDVSPEADPNPNPDGIDDDYCDYTIPDGEIDGGTAHGTHVAGIIGAMSNNGQGVAGVAWGIKLMAVRVLDDEGLGSYADIASGITYAAENGADVINLSLGGGSTDAALEAAVEDAYNGGAAVIAAVGNDAVDLNTSPNYPSCYDNVLGVASTDYNDGASWFSNYGAPCVDVSAPGGDVTSLGGIYSTLYYNPTYSFNSYYGPMSGTSMATPVVSGIAALLKSYNMVITPEQIYNTLETTADDIGLGAAYGTGRVNANSALGGTSEYTDTTPPTNPAITAYTSSAKTTQIEASTRAADATPYFALSGAADDSGIVGYYVYFGTSSSVDPASSGVYQTNAYYSASGLSGSEKKYYLRVKAKDTAGNIAATSASFTYLIDNQASAPIDLSTDIQNGGIIVSWEDNDSHPAAYRVYRSKQSSGTYTKINTSTVSDPEFVDESVDSNDVAGATYYYKVKTIDDLGNVSGYSQVVAGTYFPPSDIVVGTEDGGAPQVLVYDYEGNLKSQFFAYSSTLRTGVSVAVSDLNGDGENEIITGPGAGGGPQVRVFDMRGNPTITAGFFAYATTVRNGVTVGAGDLDGDGEAEIITGTRAGSGPHVRTFTGTGSPIFSQGFFAYGTNVRNGVFVAACDLDGNSKKEIVTGTDTGSGPHVRTFDRFGNAVFTPGFFAYDQNFRGGTRLACGDLNSDDRDEIITIPGPGGSAQVRVFNRFGTPTVTAGFFALDISWRLGSFVSSGDADQDGHDDIIVSADGGGTPLVVVYNPTGATLMSSFYALPTTYNAGVNVAAGAFPD